MESGVNGFIAKNLEDYIDIIENIVQNKYNIKQIQENARKSIEEKYNMQNMIDGYLELYSGVPSKKVYEEKSANYEAEKQN